MKREPLAPPMPSTRLFFSFAETVARRPCRSPPAHSMISTEPPWTAFGHHRGGGSGMMTVGAPPTPLLPFLSLSPVQIHQGLSKCRGHTPRHPTRAFPKAKGFLSEPFRPQGRQERPCAPSPLNGTGGGTTPPPGGGACKERLSSSLFTPHPKLNSAVPISHSPHPPLTPVGP